MPVPRRSTERTRPRECREHPTHWLISTQANGLCDDLLSCTARAWDLDKPVVVAPAMNTAMWSHPMTAHHLAALRGVYDAAVVAPVSKALACGDVGVGALADVDDVAAAARAALGL